MTDLLRNFFPINSFLPRSTEHGTNHQNSPIGRKCPISRELYLRLPPAQGDFQNHPDGRASRAGTHQDRGILTRGGCPLPPCNQGTSQKAGISPEGLSNSNKDLFSK